MWKSLRNVTSERAPQVSILFNSFQIMSHLGKALDEVRKAEYRRLSGQDRSYIKGQKYTLLSHGESLTPAGRQTLKELLAANKRLNTAYLLEESFGPLGDYEREAWARGFFDNWRVSRKWQRFESYEKFAAMIERNWDGSAAHIDYATTNACASRSSLACSPNFEKPQTHPREFTTSPLSLS